MRKAGAVVAASAFAMPVDAAEHTVTMQDAAYVPAEIHATSGDSIRFVNDDDADHEVFVPTVGFGVDLGKQEPGTEKTLSLMRRGTFEVECVFHPGMLLTVTVQGDGQ